MLDCVLPDACSLCHQAIRRPQQVLCTFCLADLKRIERPCAGCALPLPATDAVRSMIWCNACLLIRRKSSVVAPLAYDDNTRHLIHQIKFHQGYREIDLLGLEIANAARQIYHRTDQALPSLLIPVPLSKWNLAKRGYNQASALAKAIGQQLDIDWQPSVFRRRHGKAQRHKSRAERQRLPANTFELQKVPTQTHLAIIDDVMTTGRTTDILRRHLQRAGAEKVDIWCAARVV